MYPQYLCIMVICENLFGVTWYSIHLFSIRIWGEYMYPWYLVHYGICETCLCVTVFHRYIVNGSRGYMYHQYICILLMFVTVFGVTWYSIACVVNWSLGW